MNKTEKQALRALRHYVTLRRAAINIPGRLGSMGEGEDGEGTHVFELYRQRARAINDAEAAGTELPEPKYQRPLAEPDPSMTHPFADASDLFTNDVAEALRIYTESWILPLIDALLEEGEYAPDLTRNPKWQRVRRNLDLRAMTR